MSSSKLAYLFLAFVLLGLVAAGYLALSVFMGTSPVCGPLHGCDTVLQSEYSRVLGIPLAYLGVLYYAMGAVLGAGLQTSARMRLLALLYGLFGFICSIAFIYIQAVLIGAFCTYCVISAVATAGLAATSLLLWRNMRQIGTLGQE